MPFHSLFPDVEIPHVDLWSFFFDRDDYRDPDKPIFIDAADAKRFWTFRTLKTASSTFGAALQLQWSWRRGEVLGLFGPNDIDYNAAILGGLWAGATVSPMSYTCTATELAYQLKNSNAKAIVTHPERLDVVEEAVRLADLPASNILLFGEEGRNHAKYEHFLYLDDEGVRKPEGGKIGVEIGTEIEPDKDVALLVYSSGTTGFPKGVQLSHMNMVANICQLTTTEFPPAPVGLEAKVLAFLPFAHIYATNILIFRPLFSGPSVYVMRKFDLEQCLWLIETHRITYIPIAPPVALLFAKSPLVDKFDLSSLGGLLSAAAPLAPQLIEDLHKRLKITVKQAYGLSETAPTVTMQQWPNAFQYRGSVGPIVPNLSIKLVSEDGEEVNSGQLGELWVKGPNIFLGYYNNDEATKNAFSEDGYFKTGDIAHLDPAGNLYIVDRMKELIKYRGYQVAPAELEAVLLQNPKVSDVAVLGMYDERIASEVPRAFVKVAPGLEPSKILGEEIVEWMDARVSYPKKLRGGVQFVDEVPKSAAGKILRRVLKDTYGLRITVTVGAKL